MPTGTPGQARRPRAPRQQKEHFEQKELFRFLSLYAPRVPAFRTVFAIPNAGKRSEAAGARLKAEGMRPGAWDVVVPIAAIRPAPDKDDRYGQISPALWIEMKATTDLTPGQVTFREVMSPFGHEFVVCRSWLDAARVICEYLSVTDPAVWDAIRINEKGPVVKP